MAYSWISLVPPLIVIAVTILTRNVLLSLAAGIITACALVQQGDPVGTITLAFQRIVEETNIAGLFGHGTLDHLYIFSFLLMLGILIQLMNHSGGIRAYTRFLLNFIQNPRQAQQVSLTLSTTLFIDDYVNNLSVGAIMRPVTDHFKIARAKLAFLLNSMSGPLCLLVPASSWVAFIMAQMQSSGISMAPDATISQDPFFAYIQALPFIAYPLFLVSSAWLIASFGISFGTMKRFEDIARTTGNLYGGKEPLEVQQTIPLEFHGTLLDFILPITLFIGTFLGGLAYSGNSIILGGTATFMETLQTADPFWALWFASIIAVAGASILFLIHNPTGYRYLGPVALQGMGLMKNSLIVLLCAWTFSTLLKNDLHTGSYLASLVPASLSVGYLPLVIFILCLAISASTGSTWGTIALMLPLALPLYTNLVPAAELMSPTLYALLGALFSGAVAGSHFSPITDAMIMTSFSAGCYHIDHVRTQMEYALPALVGTLVAYASISVLPLSASYYSTAAAAVASGFAVTVGILYACALWAKR